VRDSSRDHGGPPLIGRSLAAHTTLRLGGPAGALTPAGSDEEVVAALRGDEPVLLLAGGSNVVIGDDGYPGRVVLLRTRGFSVRREDNRVRLRIAAGEQWDQIVAATVEAGWSGLESLAGIPGSTGATPIFNVGGYGHQVAETITAVRAYDRWRDEVVSLAAAECGFAHRTSVLRHSDRYVVLAVDFLLAVSPLSAEIRYAELARALGVPLGGRAPLAEVRAAVLELGAGKGMVLDAADPDTFSVGSFFANPILGGDALRTLSATAAADGLGAPPWWPIGDGGGKISAAWLIERAGFSKGYARPGAGVGISGKRTLALTNRGRGSTAELLALARQIRDGVAARFGVALQPEPVLVNCVL
jgi:UDP-N-acetylmuramate dehydrogenase